MTDIKKVAAKQDLDMAVLSLQSSRNLAQQCRAQGDETAAAVHAEDVERAERWILWNVRCLGMA